MFFIFKHKKKLLLSIAPIIYILISIFMRTSLGPYWEGNNSDPEYVYLFSSLNMLHLNSPSHHDHPGTTLQVWGALVILFKYLYLLLFNHGESNLTLAVLKYPEEFLKAINTSLIIITTFTLYFSGIVLTRFNNIKFALSFQFSIFLFPTIMMSFPRVTPEPLLVIFSIIIITLIEAIIHTQNSGDADKEKKLSRLVLATGIIAAAGLVTKVTFLPLLLLLTLIRPLKYFFKALLSMLAFVFIFTTPIMFKYANVTNWFKNIIIHKDLYGNGAIGLPTIKDLTLNLENIYITDSLFLKLVLTLTIFTLVVKLLSKKILQLSTFENSLFFVGPVICLVQIAITLKHPGMRYLLPSMIICGWMLSRISYKLHIILLSSSYIFFLLINSNAIKKLIHNRNLTKTQLLEINALSEAYKDYRFIYTYRSSSKLFALSYGNSFSGSHLSEQLTSIYTNTPLFNSAGGDEFYNFSGTSYNLSSSEQYILQGSYLGPSDSHWLDLHAKYSKDFRIKFLRLIGGEYFFQIDSKLKSNFP